MERMRDELMTRFIWARVMLLAAMFAAHGATPSRAGDWDDIRNQIFGTQPISDAATSTLVIYGPNQAADGALVPISIHMPTATAKRAKTLTLVIDRNPAPIAATFHFGEVFRGGDDIADRIVATRIRIDDFSQVRAIVETTDGEILMSAKFIAGAGGCSALPSKDPDEALASIGRMKVKLTAEPDQDPSWREGMVMLRHPNFTGMQMDPKRGGFTPARFVRELVIEQGDRLVMRMVGGISISEDPNLRFTFASAADAPLVVSGEDTEGAKFAGRSDDPGS